MTVGVNDDYLVTNTITKVNKRIMESVQELLQLYQVLRMEIYLWEALHRVVIFY